jgi:hypothetical protein
MASRAKLKQFKRPTTPSISFSKSALEGVLGELLGFSDVQLLDDSIFFVISPSKGLRLNSVNLFFCR